MKFKNVIAAVAADDDLAAGVISAARSMAERDGARMTIVSAWPLLSTAIPSFTGEAAASSVVAAEALAKQNRDGRQQSEMVLKEMAAKYAPNADVVVLDGDPAEEVASYAEKNDADLIVTGSHQRNFWGTLFQGSASRDLVREAPCAVFLVTKAFAESREI